MKNTRVTAVLAIFAFAAIVAAQGQQTPEQREAAAKERHEKELATTRPIAAADGVWLEDLTYLEVRDAIKAGKTTVLSASKRDGSRKNDVTPIRRSWYSVSTAALSRSSASA